MPNIRTHIRVSLIVAFCSLAASAAVAQPSFTKVFVPDTIGPGGTSTLTFTIDNTGGVSTSDLAFVDSLPAGVAVQSPANVSTTCGDGVVTTVGDTISFSDGTVPGGDFCLVSVEVTSSTVGIHTNVSGDLTSSAGNSGTATDDLAVATDRPGFSKSFSPTTIGLGGRSTLTFLIDNTLNASIANGLNFNDNLPTSLVVADPANAVSTCTGGVPTAIPGSGTVAYGPAFFGDASVAAMATCTVSVDVTGVGIATAINVSSSLTSSLFGPLQDSGKAVAAIEVTGGALVAQKSFTDDPALPGATVTLAFTVLNRDRDEAATNIAFTDDLDATLSGLVATGLPANDVCGPGSTLTATSLLSLTGGSLPAEGSCTFSVTLQVPAAAVPGAYPNVTSTVTADVGGSPITGDPAAETLFVDTAPLLTKTFLTSQVGSGDTTTLEFTITNTSSTEAVSNMSFNDDLSSFLSGVTPTSLPAAGFCGAGSALFTQFIGGNLNLSLIGGNLLAGGSCTFSADLLVPAGTPAGAYVNTTGPISGEIAGTSRVGRAATATLDVVAAPGLTKQFTDDPVQPGDTVTLEFTIEHSELATADATAIAFTDDLNVAAGLTGLAAVGLPLNDVCGVGSQISGTTNLSFTGGTLAPGASCTFSVTVQVPAAALPGSFLNATSNVMATVSGLATIGQSASDSLEITGLMITKEFIDDPLIPGETGTLRFTIDNTSPTADATGMFLTDSLSTTLSGLVAVAPLPVTPCGAGSSVSGTGFLIFVGGNLTASTSCTFDVLVQVPGGAPNGSFGNVTSNLTATVGGTVIALPPAADALTVTDELLFLEKTFLDNPAMPGETVSLEFSIDNMDATEAATGITFTDDLDAALTGLAAIGLPLNDVCGVGSTIAGTSLLTLTGGTVPANGNCTFTVDVLVPAGAPLGATVTNTTDVVSGTIGGLPVVSNAATDDLFIEAVTFTKSFDGPTTAGGAPVLTFSIENLSAITTVSSLAFSDDLDATLTGLVATGLPLNDVCGMGSVLSGTSFLTLTGASLLPGGSCTFMVPLQVPAAAAAGSFPNTTSDLTESGLTLAEPATATLVIEPPPIFAKSFAPMAIGVGLASTVTLTIDNTASVLSANNLDVTDNLPAGMVVATPANASTTCTGGTLTAADGSGVVTYTGGGVAAGTSCTITVNVVGNAVGALVNTTGDLTSSSGNSGPATDTLTVVPQPGFAKAFAPNPTIIGGVSTVTLTIDNASSTVTATGLDVTDNLPAGMVVATPPNASTTCTGGTLTAVAGAALFSYSGGTVAASTSCTVSVDVTPSVSGALVNTTGDLTSSLGNSGPATDTLTVNPPPAFTKVFAPNPIPTGTTSTLTFTIDNTGSTVAATALDVTDNLPAAIVVATPPNASTTCTGGTVTAVSGTSVITYTGGTVAAGATCTVEVDVASSTVGSHVNLTGDLTSSLGSSGTATDALVVEAVPPLFAKAFMPDTVLPAGVSTLVLTIDNAANSVAVGGIGFTDSLSPPVVIATPANASSTCAGGTLTAPAGGAQIVLSGATAPASGTCAVSVDVVSPAAGTFVNVTSTLVSDAGTGTTAQATLTVLEALEFEKIFTADPVLRGGQVDLEYTITNPSATSAVDGITFSDDLDTVVPGMAAIGLPLTDACGTGSLVAGAGTVTLTGGSLGAAGSCTFAVTVQVPAAAALGTFVSTTGPLQGMVVPAPGAGGGTPISGPTASANLTVDYLEITKTFDQAIPALAGATVDLTFTLTNPDPANAATQILFSDDLDAVIPGLSAVGLPLADVCGVGSIAEGTTLITVLNGNLGPAETCTFTVSVLIPPGADTGTFTNVTSVVEAMVQSLAVTGDAGSGAVADLEVLANTLAIPTLQTWGLLLLVIGLAIAAVTRMRAL